MPTYRGIHWAKKILPVATSFGWHPELGSPTPDPGSQPEIETVIKTMAEEAGTKSKPRRSRSRSQDFDPAAALTFLAIRRQDRYRMMITAILLGILFLGIGGWVIYGYLKIIQGAALSAPDLPKG